MAYVTTIIINTRESNQDSKDHSVPVPRAMVTQIDINKPKSYWGDEK